MRRIQCTVCKEFMSATPERLCSEECREVQKKRNQVTIQILQKVTERQLDERAERKKIKAESKRNREEKKRRKREERAQKLQRTVKKQAGKIRAIKQKRRPDGFYEGKAWQQLRYEALKVYGRKCMLCFATDCELHVDHIKPRSKYPDLELKFENLQVLCRACNLGKSNLDETDWRKSS